MSHPFKIGETVLCEPHTDRTFIIKEVNGDELLLVGHHAPEAKGSFIQKWKPANICHLYEYQPITDTQKAIADLSEKLNAVRDNLLSDLVNRIAIGIDRVKQYNELIKQVFGD